MDAIEILKSEHRKFKISMDEILRSGDSQRTGLLDAFKREIEMNNAIEEGAFYPAIHFSLNTF